MNRLALITLLLASLFARARAADSVVVFNELNYHPVSEEATHEWIELHNQMAIDIDLSGWQIDDGLNFSFAEGTIIPGGGYLVIARHPATVQAATGLTQVLGPFAGSLNNAGETLELRDCNGRLMDRLTYADRSPWPLAADGSGATLAKRDQNSPSADPDNWTSSVVVDGTPGTRNFPEASVQIHPVIALASSWRFEASGADLGTDWKERDSDDRSWSGQNGATLVSYWPFDGNAVAIRGTDGAFWGAVSATPDRNGIADGALAFSGDAQYVSVPAGGGLNGVTAGTIGLWVKWNTVSQDADCCGSFGAILARQGDGLFSDNILALSTANPLTAKLDWRQSGGPAPILLTGTTPVGAGWHHVAVTFSPSGSTLYLDGVEQGSASGRALNASAAVPLSIGAWAGDGSGFLQGALDDVAIWDQPLDASQIRALAISEKNPLDFSGPESAIYYSGNGRLAENDERRATQLPVGPTTYYFRKSFAFSDSPTQTTLQLDLLLADGAVVYLNGIEVYRRNLPAGEVHYTTPAVSTVGPAPLLAGIPLPSTYLVAGTNVLAVEVHSAESPNPGMVFGAGLNATITPPGLKAVIPDKVAFNEISAPEDDPFQVELFNHGTTTLDLAGYIIRRTGDSPDTEFTLPEQTLASGAFLVLDETALGFRAAVGDKLFLLRPQGTATADAVAMSARRQARSPDGTGEFLIPSVATFGAPNEFALHDEIVFNEILYHAPPTLAVAASGGEPAVPYQRNPEQWIEMFNRSTQAIDLTGWRLAGGIGFSFPARTSLPAGGYLVVAQDPAALRAKHPGVVALGPFTNRLSGSGDTLVLRDANDNPADFVHYFDDGRWPEAADGGGSSLELRDPRSNNSVGENWAASDESRRSTWHSYTYEGVAAASAVGPDSQWREFVIGLLDKGEVLLDDLSVIESPDGTSVSLLQNGTFNGDASHWRIIGNHHGTVIEDPDSPGNNVLRLVATGSTDPMSNHAETTFANGRGVVNGRTYRISYRAKWISGCRQLNTRLYFNRLARTTILDGHTIYGTPGAPNTAFTPNLGPTYSQLRHEPVVPAPGAPVTIQVSADDPDGVTSLTLWSRPDGGTWMSQPMNRDMDDADGYRAVLPGRDAGKIVQFYVEGADSRNATSVFPAAGPESRGLYQVDDDLAQTNGLHNMRLIALTSDADQMHQTINLMSNQRIGVTVVYDEREVFYNAGLRLKGSEHSRTSRERLGFNLGFNSEQLFRGIHHSVALDRSESTGFGQREMLLNQVLNHCGGLPTKYHDLTQVIAPRREHTGPAELQLARYTDVFLKDQYENGEEGMVFEYELIYQLNSTDTGSPEGNKVPAPDSVVGTPIRNLGNDAEGYRWTFLIKNNEDRDDYSRIIPWARWMGSSGTAFTSQISTYLDVDQWLRGHAVNVLSGVGDSYGGDGSQHNVQFYVRPSDGRLLYFPHDMDAFFNATRGIVPNADLAKIIAVPAYARAYYGHLLDIMGTTYNSAYLTRWANHLGRLLPGQPFASHLAFVTQRRNFVMSAVNSAVSPSTPFTITSNGGNETTTANSTFTLTGTANLTVSQIMVNAVAYPITWTSRTAWSITVPLVAGPNALTVQGVDRTGRPLATAVDMLNVTNTGTGVPQSVKINEWMADNSGPGGYADPADGSFRDWIELFNPNAAEVDLSGYTLTDDLSRPATWTIPAGTRIEGHGFLLIWAGIPTPQIPPAADLHANFQLRREGESIGLYDANGVAQHTVIFGPQAENVSEGLYPDGNIDSVISLPNWTPRHPNTLVPPLRITAASVTDGLFTFTWTSIPQRIYRVEFCETLGSPWIPLLPDLVAEDNILSVQDTVSAESRRCYRVRRLE